MTLDDRERPLRFLIHDRDAKFSGGFDQIFLSEGLTVIRTPFRHPTRTHTPSAGSAACDASASIGCSSSADGNSSTCFAFIPAITTIIGRTARLLSAHRSRQTEARLCSERRPIRS
jgi:hypothetical protein